MDPQDPQTSRVTYLRGLLTVRGMIIIPWSSSHTLWIGIPTPKHLLKRPLECPYISSQGIWIIWKTRVKAKWGNSTNLHKFRNSQKFPSTSTFKRNWLHLELKHEGFKNESSFSKVFCVVRCQVPAVTFPGRYPPKPYFLGKLPITLDSEHVFFYIFFWGKVNSNKFPPNLPTLGGVPPDPPLLMEEILHHLR